MFSRKFLKPAMHMCIMVLTSDNVYNAVLIMIYFLLLVRYVQGYGGIQASKAERWGLYCQIQPKLPPKGTPPFLKPCSCEKYNWNLLTSKGAVLLCLILCYFGDQVIFCPGIISWLAYSRCMFMWLHSCSCSFSKNLWSAAVLGKMHMKHK